MKSLFIPLTFLALVIATGCGSSSSSDSPAPAAGSLSSAFASNCASCHGSAGQGATEKALKGTSLTLAIFKSTVRQGKGTGMASFSTTVYPDASLEADYTVLNTK